MKKTMLNKQNLNMDSYVRNIAVTVYPEQLGLAPDASADEFRDKLKDLISVIHPFRFLVIGTVHDKPITDTSGEKHNHRKPHAHLMITSSGGTGHRIDSFLETLHLQSEEKMSFPIRQIQTVKDKSGYAHYISYVSAGRIGSRKFDTKTLITNDMSGFISLISRFAPATDIPEI
ncbi:MAG: hypothetical protein K5669_09250 [Lachnospiraceae bacterium]|nr:hypothetical protein [Lachnospiraceae bacterium]